MGLNIVCGVGDTAKAYIGHQKSLSVCVDKILFTFDGSSSKFLGHM